MGEGDDLKRRIVDSGLLEPAELDTLAEEAAGAAGAPPLLEFLTKQGRLTEFEAGALAAGFTGPFLLGPYRVQERIAAGRRGDLFRAVHVEFDQPVTLKVFSATQALDPEQLASMRREIRVAVQLDHPHVIRSFHVSRVGNLYFIAFEHLSGESLATRLARENRFSIANLCSLGHQAAQGLESLHAAGIVHGDLRPANLWINEQEQLKIVEFGAARDSLSYLDQADESAPAAGETATAPPPGPSADNPYGAPEVAHDANAADARSDSYSLGAILFHVLLGHPPAPDTYSEELASRVVVCPPELVDLIGRLLSAEPAARPALSELSAELSKHFDEGDVTLPASWNNDFLAWAEEAKLPVADDLFSESRDDDVSAEFAEFAGWLSSKK